MFFKVAIIISLTFYPKSALAIKKIATSEVSAVYWSKVSAIERVEGSLRVKRIQQMLRSNQISVEKAFKLIQKTGKK